MPFKSIEKRRKYIREYLKKDLPKQKKKIYDKEYEKRDYVRTRRKEYRNRPEVKNRLKSPDYLEKRNERQKLWATNNKDKLGVYYCEYGKREEVKKKRKEYSKKDYVIENRKKNMELLKQNPEWRRRRLEKTREWAKLNKEQRMDYQRKRKEELANLVFNHYSRGKLECACCGDNRYCFLTIDHVVPVNGKKKERKAGANLYGVLVRNKYPLGFQVLCMNCNKNKSIKEKCGCKEFLNLSFEPEWGDSVYRLKDLLRDGLQLPETKE